MQSMNQSLLALLVNGKITYRRAMELSTDPEDLSLKLRKLFPQIEDSQRGGSMPSDNDFSAIVQLMDTKHLYEEQEEKWKLRLAEKDAEIARFADQLDEAHQNTEGRGQTIAGLEEEIARLKAENERIVAGLPEQDQPVERAHPGAEPAGPDRRRPQGRPERLLQEVKWRATPRAISSVGEGLATPAFLSRP